MRTIIYGLLRDTYKTIDFADLSAAVGSIYNAPPDLIVIDLRRDDTFSMSVLSNLKQDPMFSHLPVLAILQEEEGLPPWDILFTEDYIWRPDLERDIHPRVDLAILRSERIAEVNPLTRLPGNISINKQIQGRIDREQIFALAYLDLDQFKPYNDKYGFSRGDEVIKMSGRLILNMVRDKQPLDSFVGHVGGDDFVFVMEPLLAAEASEEIIEAFDRIVPTFYDPEDRIRGYVESMDRMGNAKTFPLITVSIGVADNRYRAVSHYGEIVEVASEMKSFAKSFEGSCYRVDKRRPARSRSRAEAEAGG